MGFFRQVYWSGLPFLPRRKKKEIDSQMKVLGGNIPGGGKSKYKGSVCVTVVHQGPQEGSLERGLSGGLLGPPHQFTDIC